MRYAKQTLDGAYQGVIRFFKGRDIADVFEEFSEDALARGLKEGFIDGQAVLRDLRKVEQATGLPLVPDRYGYDPANEMPLLEGFSKLARAHAWGNVRTGALPERTARWMDMLVATQAGMLRKAENSLIRSDLARAGQFKEALAKGEVTPELEKLLGESIGIGREPTRVAPKIGDRTGIAWMGTSSLPPLTTFSVSEESDPRQLRVTNGPGRPVEVETDGCGEHYSKYARETAYRMSLRRIPALRGKPEREWEFANTAGYNLVIRGNGLEYRADDVVGDTVVEVKYIGNPRRSPFVEGSEIPDRIRRKILDAKIERAFRRIASIIRDDSNPLAKIEVVINDSSAEPYFIDLLKRIGLNGRVIVR